MRKTGNGTYRAIETKRALFARKQNRGTNGSPGRPELHYKRKGWVVKRRQQKQREKEEIFKKKTISKSVERKR